MRRTLLLFVSTSQYHQNNVQAEISEVSGIDFASLASAGEPTLTEDQISQLVDALVPVARTMLPTKDAEGNGMISAQCCTKMAPLVTENCMCTELLFSTSLNF